MLRRSRIDDDLDLDEGGPVSGRVLVLNDDPDAGELIARLVETTGVDAERCTLFASCG